MRAQRVMMIGFPILLMLLTIAPAGAQDADDAEITVQAFLCPVEYDGGDFGNDCAEPAEGVLVFVSLDGSEFQTEGETDANGQVTFTGLAAGAYTVELGVPGDFADFLVSCGVPGGTEGLDIEGAGTNRIDIELGEGASPTCTWFIIGENAAGFTPTPEAPETTPAPTATAAAEAVADLPDTGAGSAPIGVPTRMALIVLLGFSALLVSTVATRWTRLR